MKEKHRILDWIAAWMGVFDVDWDAEIADDGYTDTSGRAPIGEPLWFNDLADRPVVHVVRTQRAGSARRA